MGIHTKTIADYIEEILDYMTLSDWRPMKKPKDRGMLWQMGLPMTYFNDAEPWLNVDVAIRFHTEVGVDDEFFVDPKIVTMHDVSDIPLDIAWISGLVPIDEEVKTEDVKFMIARLRKPQLKELRGVGRLPSTPVVEFAKATVYKDAIYEPGRGFKTLKNGLWTTFAAPVPVEPDPNHDKQEHSEIQVALSLTFTNQFFWQVSLGYEGSPRIRFRTDPLGVREVFRLRDIPEGRNRRAALRHWVSEHWNPKKLREQGLPPNIPKHLRGATTFSWNGLVCKVMPSLSDQRILLRAMTSSK